MAYFVEKKQNKTKLPCVHTIGYLEDKKYLKERLGILQECLQTAGTK